MFPKWWFELIISTPGLMLCHKPCFICVCVSICICTFVRIPVCLYVCIAAHVNVSAHRKMYKYCIEHKALFKQLKKNIIPLNSLYWRTQIHHCACAHAHAHAHTHNLIDIMNYKIVQLCLKHVQTKKNTQIKQCLTFWPFIPRTPAFPGMPINPRWPFSP